MSLPKADAVAGPYEGEDKVEAAPAVPSTPAASVAQAPVAAGDEVVSERSAYKRSFATSTPGVLETRVYQAPVNFREGAKWSSIDNRLAEDASGTLANRAAPFDLAIAQGSQDPQLVDLDLGRGRSLSWRMAQAADAPRSKTATTATFKGVRSKVDLRLRSTRTGVKEDIILASADAPRTFDFPLQLAGLTPRMAGGSVEFVDADGAVAAVIPDGFMTDAAGEVSEGVDLSLVGEGSRTLRVSIDDAWVSDADRQFPVTVDPTVQFTATGDTMVNEGNPSYNYSGWTFMRAGLFGSSRQRSLVKFNVDALSSGWVESASLNLYNESSVSCTPSTIQAKRIDEAWLTTSVGWPKPTLGSVVGQVSDAKGGPGCAPGYVSIPVTQAIRDWSQGTKPNYGLAVTVNEYATESAKTFTTVDEGANEPYLKVTWRQKDLGVQPWYTLNSDQLTDRLRQQVNVANGNLVLEGADVNLPGVAGMNMTVGRYYNSRDDGTDVFGQGWSSTIGQSIRLVVESVDKSAVFEGPSGFKVNFTYDAATGTWKAPAGLNATLTKSGSTYTLRMNDSGLRYTFTDGSALDEVEDKNGNTITYGYTSGRVTSITDSHGDKTTVDWNAAGYISTITDPRGRTATYGYSGFNLTSSTDQDGKTTSYGYDSANNLTSVTDPRGKVTAYTYDATDRLATITWADSTTAKPAVTRYAFTADSSSDQKVKMTDQRGNVWNYTFDASGRVKSFLSPRSGNPETKAYDVNNSVTQYTTAQGGTGTLSYDGYNVTSISEANGAKSTFDYLDGDTKNKPSKYTDPRGVGIDYDWNSREQLTKVTTSDSQTTINYQSATDACPGMPSSSKDGKGNVTTYTYTGCNLTKIDRPAPAGDSTMTYDSNNRLATATDGKGNKQTITYNAKDQVTKITWTKPGASTSTSSVTYTYDANGNRTQRVDAHAGTSKTTAWGLDARNRVTSEDLPNVDNSYTYDVAGNMASMTTPAGTTTYTYDIENDPASVTTPAGKKISMGYGEHVSAWIDYPGGVRDRQDMDSSGRIQRIYQNRANPDNTFTALTDLNYGYTSPGGKKTSRVYAVDDDTFNFHVDYDYDSSGRITHESSTKNNVKRSENTYGYDANSNMTSQSTWITPTQTNSVTSSYNAANQLTAVSGDFSMSLTYDANGSYTGDNQGGAASYDERGRTSASTARLPDDATSQDMTYDGASQVERTRAGATTFTNSLLGVTSSTTGGKTTEYVLAPDGRVLGQVGPDGKSFYYLRDRLGSIIGVTNESGQRVNDYWYDPYGGYQGGQEPDAAAGIPHVPWRYTGEWADGHSVTSSTYKIGLRYYDPMLHRWTQPDPLERITNPASPAESQPYNYVGCNPTNYTDPTGASWEDVVEFFGYAGSCLQGGMYGAGVLGGAAAVSVVFTLEAPIAAGLGFLGGCAGNVILNGIAGTGAPPLGLDRG